MMVSCPSGKRMQLSLKPICLALAFVGSLASCADLHGPPPTGQGGEGTPQGAAPGDGGRQMTVGGMSSGGTSEPSSSDASTGGSSSVAGASAAGSSALAGSSSGGTSGGTSGSSGQGGSAGTGAPSAKGGAGSDGGGGGCQGPIVGNVRAWFYPELGDPTTNEIHPFFALTTTGKDIPLKELAIRYYFTAEMTGDWETECIWVTEQGGQNGGLCSKGTELKIRTLDPPAYEADHYLEVTFPGVEEHVVSAAADPPFEARTRFFRVDHPNMIQNNDYSFDTTSSEVLTIEKSHYRPTARVTVYRNGTLIWGQEPCP